MPEKTPALMLGAGVRFQDCWAGKVAAIEVTEDWEIYNVTVRRGIFRASTVRLPLEAATGWDEEHVAFDQTTSGAAFGREVPPVAGPSRPVSLETPVSGGYRLAGFLVSTTTRMTAEVLVERRGRIYRVPTDGVTFEGKIMHPGARPEALVPYYSEKELRERVRQALGASRDISSAELRRLDIEAAGPGVRLTGNLQSKRSREAARLAASDALGIPVDASAVTDDHEVETSIGLTLGRSGVGRTAEVYSRSNLGDVVLRGRAPSQQAADEVARVVAGVPGVRTVVNRIEVGSPLAHREPVAQ